MVLIELGAIGHVSQLLSKGSSESLLLSKNVYNFKVVRSALTTLASMGASRSMHPSVIGKIVGAILITIKASLHRIARPTMESEKGTAR